MQKEDNRNVIDHHFKKTIDNDISEILQLIINKDSDIIRKGYIYRLKKSYDRIYDMIKDSEKTWKLYRSKKCHPAKI